MAIITDGARHKKHDLCIHHAYSLPAVLTVFNPALLSQLKWVRERTNRRFKAHTVLEHICFCLVFIQFKFRLYNMNVTTLLYFYHRSTHFVVLHPPVLPFLSPVCLAQRVLFLQKPPLRALVKAIALKHIARRAHGVCC